MKKVMPEQIDRLYEFTRQHYVEYYDVQTELVDHLANAIETHWQEFPDEAFETVLQKEFRKFGVFGFSDVVEQKTKEMTKRYHRILWRKKLEFFTPPKLILTLLIGVTLYTLFYLFDDIRLPFFGLYLLVSVIIYITDILRKRKRKKENKDDRKWLFETIFRQMVQSSLLSFMMVKILLLYILLRDADTPIILISLAFLFFSIDTYITRYYLPKNKEKYLSEIYPEYNIFTRA